MTIRCVFVPTDFSDHANSAVQLGHHIAARHRAKLVVHHVSGLPDGTIPAPEPAFLPVEWWLKAWNREREHIESLLQKTREELAIQYGPDVEIATGLARGNTATEILRAANEHQADLIVMGAKGRSGSLRYLFGSVSSKIARAAPCPVLVTRPEAFAGSAVGFRQAVVAVDYSPVSGALDAAARRLVDVNGNMLFLHVWQQPTVLHADPELAADLERVRSAEVVRMDEFLRDLPDSGVLRTGRVDIGSPAQEILARSEEHGADLVVLGAHARHGAEKLIGTVADRVLRHSTSCVLLVPTS